MPSSAIHFILARWLQSLELRCSTSQHGRCCCWHWYGRSRLQRMKYEEFVLLQSFPEYGDYMARTARLVPGVY